LVPNKNIIIAVFRGTEFSSWSNLVQDVQSIDKQSLASGLAEFKPPAGVNVGKVGKGFVDAYSSIRSQFFGAMKKALKELAQANYNNQTKPKLIITGHSLGGAIASVAAADLKFNTANSSVGESMASVEVWTFESPRPGDVDFALASQQHMTANQWHIENYFDLIPKLPGVDEGFAHPARYV
jgi:predicted lipase